MANNCTYYHKHNKQCAFCRIGKCPHEDDFDERTQFCGIYQRMEDEAMYPPED